VLATVAAPRASAEMLPNDDEIELPKRFAIILDLYKVSLE
jgi:hypothetical protein